MLVLIYKDIYVDKNMWFVGFDFFRRWVMVYFNNKIRFKNYCYVIFFVLIIK